MGCSAVQPAYQKLCEVQSILIVPLISQNAVQNIGINWIWLYLNTTLLLVCHCIYLPVWARGRCRISPPRFLAECCKRQLNQGIVLFCELFVFSCTVFFVSISQVIGCEDRHRNDFYCVGWGITLYSNQSNLGFQSVTF